MGGSFDPQFKHFFHESKNRKSVHFLRTTSLGCSTCLCHSFNTISYLYRSSEPLSTSILCFSSLFFQFYTYICPLFVFPGESTYLNDHGRPAPRVRLAISPLCFNVPPLFCLYVPLVLDPSFLFSPPLIHVCLSSDVLPWCLQHKLSPGRIRVRSV